MIAETIVTRRSSAFKYFSFSFYPYRRLLTAAHAQLRYSVSLYQFGTFYARNFENILTTDKAITVTATTIRYFNYAFYR